MRAAILAFIAVVALCGAGGTLAWADTPSAATGHGIFDRTCRNCHSLDVGVNKVGPSLWHVVGRPSASMEGYNYSDAMKQLHGTWTAEALNLYLADPRGDVHGAKMFFMGLKNPQDRMDVIAYLTGLQ